MALNFKNGIYRPSSSLYGSNLMAMRGPDAITHTFPNNASYANDQLTDTVANSGHGLNFTFTQSSGVVELEFKAKSGTQSWAWAYFGSYSGGSTWFNLSNGTLGTVESGVEASITPADNGYYLCRLRRKNVSTAQGCTINAAPSNGAGTYAGTGGVALNLKDISVREVPATYTRSGAKSELNASGTPIAFAANEPGIVPGLGFWSRGAVTNLLLRSQEFDGASWTRANLTASANATLAPDGSTTAETFSSTGSNACRASQPITLASGTAYTASIFLKKGTHNGFISFDNGGVTVHCYAKADLDAGTVAVSGTASATIVSCGGGWYRVNLTWTSTVSGTVYVSVGTWDGSADQFGYPGTSAAGRTVHLWQAQVVTGTLPGPIIVTTGSTGPVGADVLKVTDAPADEDAIFWGVFDVRSASAVAALFDWSDGTTNERFGAYGGGGNLSGYVRTGNVNQTVPNPATRTLSAGRNVVLFRRRAGKWCYALKLADGTVSIGADSGTVAMPAGINNVRPGSDYSGSNQANAVCEAMHRRRGTFSDADITAILQAA